MKKLSILFLSVLALGITLTSCSKDDSTTSIVGKWEFNTMDGTSGGQAIAAGTPEQLYADPSCTSNKSYWQFDQGNVIHYGVYTTSNCTFQNLDATYTIDSKNTLITVTTPSGVHNYPIVKLTSKELDWREQGTGKDSNGNDVTYDITHHMVKK